MEWGSAWGELKGGRSLRIKGLYGEDCEGAGKEDMCMGLERRAGLESEHVCS